jgi:hypothetical protein
VKVENTTTERKTAENLLELIDVVKSELESDWGVEFVALVTDGSGEAVKARKLFHQKYPHILVLHCFAHQVCCRLFFYTHLTCHRLILL